MPSLSLCGCLETEYVEDVTVCRFPGRDLVLDEASVRVLREELDRLIEGDDRHKLILDFGNITFFSGAARNLLIALHHRLRALGGWLIICRLNAHLREVFQVTKLDTFLDIRPTEPEELALAC